MWTNKNAAGSKVVPFTAAPLPASSQRNLRLLQPLRTPPLNGQKWNGVGVTFLPGSSDSEYYVGLGRWASRWLPGFMVRGR